jgi:hypothetical protein
VDPTVRCEERYGTPSEQKLEVAAFRDDGRLIETDDRMAWSSLYDRYWVLTGQEAPDELALRLAEWDATLGPVGEQDRAAAAAAFGDLDATSGPAPLSGGSHHGVT